MHFDAFISYSHSDCGNLAPSIQKAIENLGKPWYMLKRNLTVFRDETNLSASPELWNSIINAIDNSENLILLASPLAKESHWVNKEIEYWFSKERSGKLYIIKINGDIIWNYTKNDFDWEKTDCLPVNLKNKFSDEPLWINLNEYIDDKKLNSNKFGFAASIAKIIGGIVGKAPREIESDELKRKRKTGVFLGVGLLTLLIAIVIGVLFYLKNKVSEANSIVNNLIAEANLCRKSNINKSLLLYSYAYEKNKDTSLFKVLNQFYNENNIITEGYIVDTFNLFYSKVSDIEKKTINNSYDNINIAENISCIQNGNILNFLDSGNSSVLSINMDERFDKITSNENVIISVDKFIMTSRYAFIKISYGHFFQGLIYDKLNLKIIDFFNQESGKIPNICKSNVETVYFDLSNRFYILGYENGSFKMNLFNNYDSLFNLENFLLEITSNDHYTSPVTSLNCYKNLIFVGYLDGYFAIYENGETRYSNNFYGAFHYLIQRIKLFQPINSQFEEDYYHNYSLKNIIYKSDFKTLFIELYDGTMYKIKLNKQVLQNNLVSKNIKKELEIDDLDEFEKEKYKINNTNF